MFRILWWCFIIFIQFLRLADSFVSPVYIWKAEPTALADAIISQKDFTGALESFKADKMFVVFVELKLTKENIDCDTCLKEMKTITPKQLYNQVQDPYEALIAERPNRANAYADEQGIKNFECKPGSLMIVQFKDSDQPDKLQKHDTIMKKAVDAKCDAAIYLYLGVDKPPDPPSTKPAPRPPKPKEPTISPVLIWNKNLDTKAALINIKQADFEGMLKQLAQDSMMVVFIEENLTLKDFKCKTSQNKLCFEGLKAMYKRNFHLRIENPLTALKVVANKNISVSVDKHSKLNVTSIECNKGALVTITFTDKGNNRPKKLALHDKIMGDIIKTIKNCEVVYLYTAPDIDDISVVGGQLFQDPYFVLFCSNLTIQRKTGNEEIALDVMSVVKDNNKMTVTFTTSGGDPFIIDVVMQNNYYIVKSFKYGDHVFTVKNVETPFEFSYYCGDLAVTSREATLRWRKLQFQGISEPISRGKFKFAEAWHCVGFFSVGVISGLFVMAFMTSIALGGVVWIMDINTMSRFDDSGGKTITVNVTD